jgi:hypothetical protein
MARLPDITRDQLQPEDQQFYDAIAASRGSVRGPYGVLLHSPAAVPLQQLVSPTPARTCVSIWTCPNP